MSNWIWVIFSNPSPGKFKRMLPWKMRLGTWLVQKISGSDLTHVAVGDGQAVVSLNTVCCLYYPQEMYVRSPSIASLMAVPTEREIDIEGYGHLEGVPFIKSIIKAYTAGESRSSDCVDLTKLLLREGGINVPREVWSPIMLQTWLKENTGAVEFAGTSQIPGYTRGFSGLEF